MIAKTFSEIKKYFGQAKTFSWIMKHNPYHDSLGRFTTGGNSSLKSNRKNKVSPMTKVDDIEAIGENHFTKREFESKQKLNNHWENGRTHKEEYRKDGIITKEQYQSRALQLLESSCNDNILGFKTVQGKLIRYDIEKNDFASGNPGRGIYTMFKPMDGIKYYYDRLKDDGVIIND